MLGILLTGLAFILFSNKRYELSLVLFFGLVTNGYQILPSTLLMAGIPVEKPTDLALLYVLLVTTYRFNVFKRVIRNERFFWWTLVFVAFVGLNAFYSYYVLKYDPTGIIRIFRSNLYLLSFGVFITVPVPIIYRVIHLIAIITFIQCGLYLAQIPTGLILLQAGQAGSEVTVHDASETGLVRFYNQPIYLSLVLFYYLFQYRCRSWIMHSLVVGTLVLTVVAPLHRTHILTIALVASLYILLRQARGKRAIYIAVLLIIGYGVSSIDVVSNRLEKGITDFSNTFTTGKSLVTTDTGENTFAFRMAHLFERINYIAQTPGGYIFGIGLLAEDTPQAKQLRFEVGSHNHRTGEIAQINTSDIAWSLLILHLGLVGTVLYILVLIQLVKLFYQHRAAPFGAVGLLTTITALLISFAGVEILLIPFRTMAVLLAVVVIKIPTKARVVVQSTPLSPLLTTQPDPVML